MYTCVSLNDYLSLLLGFIKEKDLNITKAFIFTKIKTKKDALNIFSNYCNFSSRFNFDNKVILTTIFFDIFIPRFVNYLNEKCFWEMANKKLKEFSEKSDKIYEVYEKRKDFYQEMLKKYK
jgi:hypothetical protein